MPNSQTPETEFIRRLRQLVEENISNDQFGVSELASAAGMSRSNLLRRIKKETDLSAARFIREVRLQAAVELLQQKELTVSEVAYQVGFGSPSYFIKCFRESYGFPPGDLDKQKQEEPESAARTSSRKIPIWLLSLVFIILISALISYWLIPRKPGPEKAKSIAVLPFINDSSDSTNVYIINGLMDATLNKLQQVRDLRVISRTSVERYRNAPRLSSEIAEELNVAYLVEGSGQKIGDELFLNIQLIEAETDRHLWSQQYRRKTSDIFSLQVEVAKNIASQIEAIVTPEETKRMEKTPTSNLEAYDLFLKGLDLLGKPTDENLHHSIPFFKEAIQLDPEFARAYAGIAIAYFVLDDDKAERLYTDSINYYADQAMFHDPKLPQSLTAKALFYMAHKEYELAVPYFEKALELNPNSDVVLIFLVELYVKHLPNTEKYLEYALKGLEIDLIAAHDSATASYSYLHIANAFIQAGFVPEATQYVNKSLACLPENLYSQYLKAYIEFADTKNLKQLNQSLLTCLKKDSMRIDLLQEVAKSYYYLGNFKEAIKYYEKFIHLKELYQLDIYPSENAKIALCYREVGQEALAEKFIQQYQQWAGEDVSVFKNYNLAIYYSYRNQPDLAIDYLRKFTAESNFHYWTILFTEIDPLTFPMQQNVDFKPVFKQVKQNFQDFHERIARHLKSNDLI